MLYMKLLLLLFLTLVLFISNVKARRNSPDCPGGCIIGKRDSLLLLGTAPASIQQPFKYGYSFSMCLALLLLIGSLKHFQRMSVPRGVPYAVPFMVRYPAGSLCCSICSWTSAGVQMRGSQLQLAESFWTAQHAAQESQWQDDSSQGGVVASAVVLVSGVVGGWRFGWC
jgi:hypothetical protein